MWKWRSLTLEYPRNSSRNHLLTRGICGPAQELSSTKLPRSSKEVVTTSKVNIYHFINSWYVVHWSNVVSDVVWTIALPVWYHYRHHHTHFGVEWLLWKRCSIQKPKSSTAGPSQEVAKEKSREATYGHRYQSTYISRELKQHPWMKSQL